MVESTKKTKNGRNYEKLHEKMVKITAQNVKNYCEECQKVRKTTRKK